MECDPTRVCELLVGLPAVNVLGVDDEPDGPVVEVGGVGLLVRVSSTTGATLPVDGGVADAFPR